MQSSNGFSDNAEVSHKNGSSHIKQVDQSLHLPDLPGVIGNLNSGQNISIGQTTNSLTRGQSQDEFYDLTKPSILPATVNLQPSKQSNALNGKALRNSYSKDAQKEEMDQSTKLKKNSPIFDPVTSQLDQRVNLKVMEIWLNETMQTAEAQSNDQIGLNSDIVRMDQKKPLNRFNVDRITLSKAGVTNEQIDRIYRSLFVYSVGFYEMLKNAIGKCKNRPAMISNFWKVYSILLEYCCKHDYRMQIQEITEKHTEEMKSLEEQIEVKQTEFLEKEGMLKQNIQNLLNKVEEIEKERQIELQRRQQLQKDHEQQNKNYEDEILLRKRYEMKINELFILHREVETRYKRAVEEIIRIDFMKEDVNTQLAMSKADLDQFKKDYYQSEVKLQKSQQEQDYWRQQTQVLKDRELYLEDTMTKVKTDLRFSQKYINELKQENLILKNNLIQEKENNEQLESHIKNYQLQLENEIVLKGSFQEQSQRFQDDLSKITEAHSHYNKTDKLDTLEQDYFSNTNKLQEIQELYAQIKNDNELAVNRLSEMQKEKQKYEQYYYHEQCKSRELISFIEDKDRIVDKYKKDSEKLSNRLNQLEIAYDNLEIIKSAAVQKATLEFEEIKNRAMSLETMLAGAKANRAELLNRVEEEQRQHNESIQEMNKLKLQLEDKYLENQRLQATLENETKKESRWKKQTDELYIKINSYVQKKEELEKDLGTTRELLNVSESTAKAYFKRSNMEYNLLKGEMDHMRELNDMHYEDLLAKGRELMCQIDSLKIKAHTDGMAIRINKTMIAKQEQEIYELRFVQETLEKQIKKMSGDLEESQIYNDELADWKRTLEQKLKETKQKKKQELERYSEETKKRNNEIRDLKDRIKNILDGRLGVDQEVQVEPDVRQAIIQTEIFNDNRLSKKESSKNLAISQLPSDRQSINYIPLSQRSGSYKMNESIVEEHSSIQEPAYRPEPQIYQKNQGAQPSDDNQSSVNKEYFSVKNNAKDANGRSELQLPKIGLHQNRSKQFKMQNDEVLGMITERRHLYDSAIGNDDLRGGMRKSSSIHDILNRGSYQLSQENLLLLKNAPRPPKLSNYNQYDKETQKMLQGKCSLKDLLKSAATRQD
ncbi:UNKNOWN [Stylonychia lemnae]|uniref:Uncharacterized protein n=1 Tax=Stylonychia lemnae TaxID=5949 RepID=A0A078AD97_STYLE|nr:UNKNOWN [Stylonychia lemnae]|eukprot:CDW78838.1 UNKNOWN [Stylonychia lemnae]